MQPVYFCVIELHVCDHPVHAVLVIHEKLHEARFGQRYCFGPDLLRKH